MIRFQRVVAAIIGAGSLAACGDSNSAAASQFAPKMTAACIKENGQTLANYCGCITKVFVETLTERDKAFAVVYVMNDELSPEASWEKAAALGFSEVDMASLAKGMAATKVRTDKECPK